MSRRANCLRSCTEHIASRRRGLVVNVEHYQGWSQGNQGVYIIYVPETVHQLPKMFFSVGAHEFDASRRRKRALNSSRYEIKVGGGRRVCLDTPYLTCVYEGNMRSNKNVQTKRY